MLAGELGERVLGLGADRLGNALGYEVHYRDRRAVMEGQRIRDPQGELGMGTAADRDEDPADVARAALLDDRDVARRLAHGLVDRGRDHGPPPSRCGPDLPPQPKIMRSASCSAAASTMPAAAWRPIRTNGWITVPSGA